MSSCLLFGKGLLAHKYAHITDHITPKSNGSGWTHKNIIAITATTHIRNASDKVDLVTDIYSGVRDYLFSLDGRIDLICTMTSDIYRSECDRIVAVKISKSKHGTISCEFPSVPENIVLSVICQFIDVFHW